jgi:hypothetical protein
VFLPKLARALGAQGAAHRRVVQHQRALDAFAEGLRHALSAAQASPEASTDLLVNSLARGLKQTCAESGLSIPDELKSLLARLPSD